ncbi:MAG: T9SS type A sorting domain-containing protein [Bacteroidales bacterium]|nr:T9SS type A sorting domain-containing protein [Bacteroidales bacterium]MDD2323799.1 T9SS type A sorting domain-containing protein [Bacteroidales bacterium]MDD3961663.1 T9SS type A sorting domain-containing protein [Bacteroidales bacterium]MDY0285750.1 T9SS type A sorting domain-containing protein [Bacteroidales bacterium]
MKRIYLLAVFILAGLVLKAQVQRRVFIEEATNASCAPCASQNPAFDALLQANSDKVAVVKYHWYFPGTDPMHAQNPDENNGRVAYYGINGVPTAIIDGVIPSGSGFGYPGAPSGFTQTLINQYYNTPAPVEMLVYENIDTEQNLLNAYVLIHALAPVTGNLRVQTAVVEKHIHFNYAPGSNGEKDFYDVMKKMLPNHNGTQVVAMEAGDYIMLHQQWDYNGWTIYNEEELSVISWLQNNTSKTVYQSAIGNTEMFQPLYNTDVEIVEVINVPDKSCTPSLQPGLLLRNNGSEIVTEMEIQYTMNNGTPAVFLWSGALAFTENVVVSLPAIAFTLEEENLFQVSIPAVNGSDDQYIKNNSKTKTVLHAVKSEDYVRLMLRTDNKPEEITWKITNSENEIIHSGGPYTQPNQMINTMLPFDLEDCYQFTIHDAGGDGICCENGVGFFALSDHTNSAFVEGGNFSDSTCASFKILKGVGLETRNDIGLKITPNPASDRLELGFTLSKEATVRMAITDLTGRVLQQENPVSLPQGIHTVTFDIADFPDGMYLVRIGVEDSFTMNKFLVKK